MTSPFDYVKSITTTKENMMRDTENDELAEQGYNQFLTNNALSYFPDTILHANLMNQNYHLENRPQYEFLLNSIRPKKRFAKWVKTASLEELDIVAAYYDCNITRAREYLPLLSGEQLTAMKKELETGGLQNESSRQLSGSGTSKR
jgi:hypothetical protein